MMMMIVRIMLLNFALLLLLLLLVPVPPLFSSSNKAAAAHASTTTLAAEIEEEDNGADDNDDEDRRLACAIVDWVRREGGFFSPKLEIRRRSNKNNNGDVETGPLGVFAAADLEAHERLVEVPPSCYIALWGDERIPVDEADESGAYYYRNLCRLSQKVAGEMNKGNESRYAPFVRYLRHQKPGQLPATWSDAGKEVLRAVLTPEVDFADCVDWIDRNFKEGGLAECHPLDEHALALTVQRGYDTALVPLWDMFNHRNGHVNVENDSLHADGGIRVRASRRVREGEELYASYDVCVDCREMWWWWGTPEILRDFGFVEEYSQRWVYNDDDEDAEIWFQIHSRKGNDGSDDGVGELAVEWDVGQYGDDDPYGVPDEEDIEYLRRELERLHKVAAVELKEQQQVPTNEWKIIVQFHQAATTAVSKAVESAEALLRADKEL